MKQILAFFLLALALAAGARAQTTVTTLTMLGTNPTFNPDGSLLSAPIQGFFQVAVTVDGTVYTKPDSVTWDGTDTTRSITAAGITATYAQVTALAAAIAYKEQSGAPGTQRKAAADKISADAAPAKPAASKAKTKPKS